MSLPRLRRSGFAVGLVALSLLAGEFVARGFCRFGPEGWSRSVLGAERWELSQPEAGAAAGPSPARFAPFLPHPYVGSVVNPAGLGLTRDGFFHRDAADPGRFTIGVFGASVAAFMASRSAAILRRLPPEVTGGRAVAIRVFATPAHKQPQQLMALNYALLLGERFDVVLNLDGFNDLGFGLTNFRAQVFPLFPGNWRDMATTLADERALAELGEAAYRARRRRALAAAFARPPLAWSAIGSLAWKALDAQWAPQPVAMGVAAEKPAPGERNYLAQGPPPSFAGPTEALTAAVATWRESSLLMARLCAASGIRYVHLLQPSQYDEGSKPMDEAERAVAISSGEHGSWIAAGYRELAASGDELRRSGVRFTDLRGLFSATRAPRYIDSCCHLNRAGNDELATRAAEEIAAAFAGPL